MNRLIGLILILLFNLSCNESGKTITTITLTNLNKEQTIVLKTPENSILDNLMGLTVSGLKITVNGQINGTAHITTYYNRKTRIETGPVHEIVSGDYYQKDCKFIYQPLSVSDGILTIEYQYFKL